MKELINGQTIDFDIHKAGDGSEISIDGLHMHKRMNNKRYKGVDVLFPLDDKEDIEFRPKTTPDNIQRQLINEIKRVIKKNPKKRKELVDTIIKEIQRHTNNITEVNIKEVRRGAERIAKYFTKEGRTRNEMKQMIDNRIQFLITEHLMNETSKGSNSFFIKQDLERNRIKISDNLEALNYGNRKRKIQN